MGYSVRLPLMKMLLCHFHRWKAFFIICSNETLPKVSRHYSGFAYFMSYPMAVVTTLLGMIFLPTAFKFNNFAIVGPLFFFAGVAVLYIVSMRHSRKAEKQLKAMRYR